MAGVPPGDDRIRRFETEDVVSTAHRSARTEARSLYIATHEQEAPLERCDLERATAVIAAHPGYAPKWAWIVKKVEDTVQLDRDGASEMDKARVSLGTKIKCLQRNETDLASLKELQINLKTLMQSRRPADESQDYTRTYQLFADDWCRTSEFAAKTRAALQVDVNAINARLAKRKQAASDMNECQDAVKRLRANYDKLTASNDEVWKSLRQRGFGPAQAE